MDTPPTARHRPGTATRSLLMRWCLACTVLALLGACASKPATRPGRDGPDARPPANLEQVPDATPRIEPLRSGGPNKPYDMLGQRYVPMTADLPLQDSGLASWYGRKFHGLPTSSGEPYDMYAMTAAHKTMPIPSYARVRNPANGREITVRINDRGPFSAGRVIDLSYTAALKLGVLNGVSPVEVQRLTFADIRAGAGMPAAAAVMAAAPVVPAPVFQAPVFQAPVFQAPVVQAPVVTAPVLATPAPPAVGVQPPGAPAAPVVAAATALPPDDPLPGDTAAPAGFWVQLGAFRQRDGAQQLQQRLLQAGAEPLPGVAVFDEGGVLRVQVGPYTSRDTAEQAAARLRRQPGLGGGLVVERKGRP